MAKKNKGTNEGKQPKTLHFSKSCIKIIEVKAVVEGTDFKNYVQDMVEKEADPNYKSKN